MTFLMIVELLVVLVALWIGARYGSLALGAISGIGLAILVFGFQLKPGDPPTDVIYIIIAAVTCAGILQASGGMDWMIQIAEKLLRKHPDRITILAPLTTFFLTILVGTGHVVYTLMPIICDIALKKGIRPERPCSVASIASQIGIMCSPIAAAVVAFSAISADNGFQVSNIQIIMVSIPACIIGILAAVGYSWKRGLDLDKDPAFQAKLNNPEQREYIYGSTATTLDKEISKESKCAVYIFMGALAVIVAISLTSMFGLNVLPEYSNVKAAHHATSLNVTPTTRDTVCVRSFVFDNGKEVYLETAQAEQEALSKGMTIEHKSDTMKGGYQRKGGGHRRKEAHKEWCYSGRRNREEHEATDDEHRYSDNNACGVCAYDNILQGKTEGSHCRSSMAKRYGGSSSHLRYCVDEQHLLRQLPNGNADVAWRNSAPISVVYCHCLLCGFRTH